MLFTYNDSTSLKGKDWYALELISETAASTEATLNRVVRGVPAIFGSRPFQMFVPLAKRDLGIFELSTDSFVFVRSNSLDPLAKLKRITGVTGLLTAGRIENALPVADKDVQPMIAEAKRHEASWSKGIRKGSFVRILDGSARGYCGHVISMRPPTVRVKLLTKTLSVTTPLSNLLNLLNIPTHHQVFYYNAVLDESLQGDQS